jgi:serine/threonine protein kinase
MQGEGEQKNNNLQKQLEEQNNDLQKQLKEQNGWIKKLRFEIANGNSAIVKKLQNESNGDFGIIKYLDKGSFGSVYAGIDYKKKRKFIECRGAKRSGETKKCDNVYDEWHNELNINKKYIKDEMTARFIVAIKAIDLNLPHNERVQVDTESELMQSLHHDNIIRVHKVFKPNSFRFIVMEYCNVGNVNTLIEQGKIKINIPIVQNFARSMLSALRYLHENDIVHRDFKLDNVLVHQTKRGYTFKLADFGVSYKLIDPYVNNKPELTGGGMAGTLEYFAPEMVPQNSKRKRDAKPEKENAKVDIYALGVAVYVLLTGRYSLGKFMQSLEDMQRVFYVFRHPLMTTSDAKVSFSYEDIKKMDNKYSIFSKTESEQIEKNEVNIQSTLNNMFKERCSDDAKDFILNLTLYSANDRPTAKKLENHQWLSNTLVVNDVSEYVHRCLVEYAGMTNTQKIIRRNIQKKFLDDEDIAAIRKILNKIMQLNSAIIANDSGPLSLTTEQLKNFLIQFGITATMAHSNEIISRKVMGQYFIELDNNTVSLKTDENGNVKLDDFITVILAPWFWKTDYKADILFFKINGGKAITYEKFSNSEIVKSLTAPEKHKLFTEIDGKKKSNDKISREEFRQWIVDDN